VLKERYVSISEIGASSVIKGNDENTKALIHSNTTDGDTTIINSAVGGLAHGGMYGNTAHRVAQKRFGQSSINIPGGGASDFVVVFGSGEFDISGNKDFTFDTWFYLNVLGPADVIVRASDFTFRYVHSNTRLEVFLGGSWNYFSVTLAVDRWFHIAVTRYSGEVRVFVDGEMIGSPVTETGGSITGGLTLGQHPGGSMNGYLDEVRLVLNKAWWTSNFTPNGATYGATIEHDTNLITVEEEIPFLKVDHEIKSNKSGMTTKITQVINDSQFFVKDKSIFETGTTAIIYADLFDGLSIMKWLPPFLHSTNLALFLNVFAEELQSQYDSIQLIPEVTDPDKCPAALLGYLARSYGLFVDPDQTETRQRELIKLGQYAYQRRGAKPAVEIIFRLLGYDAVINELHTKQYKNVITNIAGDLITIESVGAELPDPIVGGMFRERDLVALADVSGNPLSFDGHLTFIDSVTDAYNFVVDTGGGSGFSIGNTIAMFNYDPDRDTTHFPYRSSYFDINVTGRSNTVPLNPDTMDMVYYYVNEFKSSHARLRDINTGRYAKAEFPVESYPEGDLQFGLGFVTFGSSMDIYFDGNITAISLDDPGLDLDEGKSLDEGVPWLTGKCVINYTP